MILICIFNCNDLKKILSNICNEKGSMIDNRCVWHELCLTLLIGKNSRLQLEVELKAIKSDTFCLFCNVHESKQNAVVELTINLSRMCSLNFKQLINHEQVSTTKKKKNMQNMKIPLEKFTEEPNLLCFTLMLLTWNLHVNKQTIIYSQMTIVPCVKSWV